MCTYLFGNLALTTLCTYKLGLAFCFCKSCGPLGLPWAVREIGNTQRAIAFIWRPSPGTMRQIYTGYLFPTSLRGVLVSDSVSRLRVLRRLLLRRLLLRRLRLLSHTTLSHTIFHHTIFHTQLALVARLGALGRRWRRGTLRGTRGTWWHPPSFRVAGVPLGVIHFRFAWQAWQAWHLWHWAGSGGALGRQWRHATFAWQVWHLVTSTFVWCGRRGPWWLPPSFCVAGVALMALGRLWWHAWARLVAGNTAPLCVAGGRFAWRHPPSLCVAGVALVTLGWLSHHLWHATLSHTISHTPLCHTPSFTHHFVTHRLWHIIFHTTLSHTMRHTPLCHKTSFTHDLWHTIFHTPLCHTLSLTHHLDHFVTHHLSHTTLSHTIFHTPSFTHTTLSPPIFDTQSFTHHFATDHLWHTIFHTTLPHTMCHAPLYRTPSFTHHLSHTMLHTHTPSFFVTHHLSHRTLSHTTLHIPFVLLLNPPPPPLSFLPSPSPLQHVLLIIGRNWLVGLSGPLILCMRLLCGLLSRKRCICRTSLQATAEKWWNMVKKKAGDWMKSWLCLSCAFLHGIRRCRALQAQELPTWTCPTLHHFSSSPTELPHRVRQGLLKPLTSLFRWN